MPDSQEEASVLVSLVSSEPDFVEAFNDITSSEKVSFVRQQRHGDDLLVNVLPDRFHPSVCQARNQFVRERHVEFVCDVYGGTALRIQTYGSQ